MLQLVRWGLLALLIACWVVHPAFAAPLEGHWTFDQIGDTSATDSSGNTRDAALQNSAAMVAGGQLGGALSLSNASTDHARVTGYTGVAGNAERTISAWIRPADANPTARGVISWGTNSTGERYTVRLDNGNSGRLRAEFSGGARHDNVATPDLWDGNWHHIAVSMPTGANRNGHDLYIDGALVASNNSGNNVTINTNTDSDVLIGARTLAANTAELPFNGLIDDTAIFSQELTAGEIGGLYNLAVETELQYNAGQANELLTIHEDGMGSVEIDGLLWEFADGLNTGVGVVAGQDGEFALQLDPSGSGVVSSLAVVPEPASIAIWSLLGMGLVGFGYYRRRLRR